MGRILKDDTGPSELKNDYISYTQEPLISGPQSAELESSVCKQMESNRNILLKIVCPSQLRIAYVELICQIVI